MESNSLLEQIDEAQDSKVFLSNEITKQFPLHQAVAARDLRKIQEILEECEKQNSNNNSVSQPGEIPFIDQRDWHGNPAIHLACHLDYRDVVQFLLAKGADPSYKNGGGWSLLQEAIASNDSDIARDIYKAFTEKVAGEYKKRVPELFKELEKLPDFYCELKWEFKSWVPFVSRFCPSDTYKIWKKGSSFRVDTTLIGFEKLSWLRGDLTILFRGRGSEDEGQVYLVDHDKKIFQKSIQAKQPSEAEIIKDIEELMKQMDLFRTETNTEKVEFNSSKGWFGSEKYEDVAGFQSKLFDMSGFDYIVVQRKRDPEGMKQYPKNGRLPSWYFRRPTTESRGKGFGLPQPYEKMTNRVKSFKGTIYLSKDFPHDIKELMPVFEVLAPTNRHFAKLKDFIQLRFPDYGFPVKLDLPIFPTMSAAVTFLQYKQCPVDNSKFEIPSDYKKGKIELLFDFGKKGESPEEDDLLDDPENTESNDNNQN